MAKSKVQFQKGYSLFDFYVCWIEACSRGKPADAISALEAGWGSWV